MKHEITKNDKALEFEEFFELEKECFDEPFNEVLFKEVVAGDYWTVRTEGKLSGFANVKVHKGNVHLSRIEVCEKFRGVGIGGELIESVISFAKEKGVSSVTLTVRTNNEAAYNLYVKKGFEDISKSSRFAIPADCVPDDSKVEFFIKDKAKNGFVSFKIDEIEVGSGIFNYEIGGCKKFILFNPRRDILGVLSSMKVNMKPGSEYIYIMTDDVNKDVIEALRNIPRTVETRFTEMGLKIIC